MTSTEANTFPDIWEWINGLPPPTQWKSDIMSVKLCSCPRVSLQFSAKRITDKKEKLLLFQLHADFQLISLYLWTSQQCNPRDSNTMFGTILLDFINGILQYGPEPAAEANTMDATAIVREWRDKSRDMLNCAFVCMCLCVCVYEAPSEIRSVCMHVLERQMQRVVNCCNTKDLLLQALGSDIEEHLMRSMGFMTTNRLFDAILKQDTSNLSVWEKSIESPYMYSYSSTSNGFWKVRLYSPLLSMKDDRDQLQCAIPIKDDRLLFALRYQHLETVVQFRYRLKHFDQEWIEVEVGIDNVRCDIFQLASSALMEKRGIPEEKHFPSKISVHIAPSTAGILSMSLSKSSDNPIHELTNERSVETVYEPSGGYSVFKSASREASAMRMMPWKMSKMSMKPWKMEQSGNGNVGTFEWILYDITNGKEVAGSKPSRMAMGQSKAWFKDRYSSAFKLFARQGGVVFAGDEYPESIIWRVRRDMEGQVLKWEVSGRIWVTYWPNKYKTSYCETRFVDFLEQVDLPLLVQKPTI
eukprot:Gb_17359 [translate_table: standard]